MQKDNYCKLKKPKMTSWGVFVAPKTIKPTSEIYRIDFLFVTDFYCLYDICMKKVEAFQTFIYLIIIE